MHNFTRILLGLLLFSFIYSTFAPVQGQVRRRRVKRETLQRIEVYLDGGYYYTGFQIQTSGFGYGFIGMKSLNDGLDAGAKHLVSAIPGLDTTGVLANPTIWGGNDEAGGTRSFGGGINFNLTRNYGVGIKIFFNIHEGNSSYYAANDGIAIPVQELGGPLLVDVLQVFDTSYNYHVAPILFNGYYRWKPMPQLDNLTLTGGAGLGFYVTTMDIKHNYKVIQEAYSSFVNLPDQFHDYTLHKVTQPIGGYIFGGANFRGSSVMSVFVDFEYHFVPNIKFDDSDWESRTDLWYYPSTLDYLYGMNLQQAFEGYNPEELGISGLRLTAGMKFDF